LIKDPMLALPSIGSLINALDGREELI